MNDYIKISAIKKYYGRQLNNNVLFVDINTDKKTIFDKISKFIKDKSMGYIDFMDYTISNENVMHSYQILKIDTDPNNIRYDLCDNYGIAFDKPISDTNITKIINIIINAISEYNKGE